MNSIDARLFLYDGKGSNDHVKVRIHAFQIENAIVELLFDYSNIQSTSNFWINQCHHTKGSLLVVPVNDLRIEVV